MRKLIPFFAIAAILFTACNSNANKKNQQANANVEMHQKDDGHQHEHGEEGHHNDRDTGSDMKHDMNASSVRVQESQTASAVIDAYLEIKNALVAGDDGKAASAGEKLMNAFDNIEKLSVSGENMSEFEDIIRNAKEQAEHISENKGNIAHQREHLEVLSTDIKDLIAITGTDRALYQVFCPMYNNNKGGMWLSASDEIKNPYYGSKMLSCGEVKAKISVK